MRQLTKKSVQVLAAILFWGGLLAAPFLAFTPTAYAAPAKCYTVAGNGSIYREVPCDSTFQSLSQVILGEPLQNDSCYGAALEAVGAIEKGAIGSDVCNSYAFGAGATASVQPKCYTVGGRVDSSSLTSGSFNPSVLQETPCTDQLRTQLPNGSQTFATGVCYIFGEGGTSATYPCSYVNFVQNEVRQEAEAIQEFTDEDRKEIIDCDGRDASGLQECLNDNPIMMWIRIGINFLSAGAGIIITIMIIVGGIQYASAGPNPQKVLEAKGRITSAIVALLALAFLYAFLQWLVPGGVF